MGECVGVNGVDVGDRFKHFKNAHIYEVVMLPEITSDDEMDGRRAVVYRNIEYPGFLYVTAFQRFTSKVGDVQRFQRVDK